MKKLSNLELINEMKEAKEAAIKKGDQKLADRYDAEIKVLKDDL